MNKSSPDNRERTEQILSILKTRSAVPLEVARREALRKEWGGLGSESAPVDKMLEYFVVEWLNERQVYSVGPAVMALSCEAVGGDPEMTVPIAAAIILIGSGAEIHDDIIDVSKSKNSRLTVFGKFGPSMALIAGNVLLTKGFALLSGKSLAMPVAKKIVPVIEIMKNAIVEHANAECLALELKGNLGIAAERYMRVIRMRGSIIEAQARIGALIGGGALSEIEALGKYGRLLGTLSLIRGEFVDLFETEELHHRMMNECLPLPILLALGSEKQKSKIIDILEEEKLTKRNIAVLVQAVFGTKKVEKLKREMWDMAEEASRAVANLKSEPVASLKLLAKATLTNL